MFITDWFMRLFGKSNKFTLSDAPPDSVDGIKEYAVRELAFFSALGLISNAVTKCEFRTYRGGKEIRDDEYYLWNISPNPNESAAQFRRKLIERLYFDNECLIVPVDKHLLIADSFNLKHKYAVYPNVYDGVQVSDYTFRQDFSAEDVLYFNLGSHRIRQLVYMLFESYKSVLGASFKAFKRSRGERGILSIDASASGQKDFREKVDDLMNNKFKRYFNEPNAVLPMFEGYKYEVSGQQGRRELAPANDTRTLINDIFDMTALAIGIPPALLRGEMADVKNQVDNFLSFCIGPLASVLECEINRKRFSRESYLNGTYLKVDVSGIEYMDIMDSAAAIDKLISSGTFSINEVRKRTGAQPVTDEWGDKHFMTKNYSEIDTLGEGVNESEHIPNRMQG